MYIQEVENDCGQKTFSLVNIKLNFMIASLMICDDVQLPFKTNNAERNVLVFPYVDPVTSGTSGCHGNRTHSASCDYA